VSKYCVEEQVFSTFEDFVCSIFPVISFSLRLILLFDSVVETDLKYAGADWYLRSHDNALCDTLNAVFLALDG